MKIAVIQFMPQFLQKEYNINKMLDFIRTTEARIIIFPELCTTGYFFADKEQLKQVAEPFRGDTFKKITSAAKENNKIIIYGFPELNNDKFYNSAAIIFPDESKSRVYRKTHLFYKEFFIFEPGDTGFFIVEDSMSDVRIGTMICYDWRFPEAARSLSLLGADLIVCPSNLVTTIWHLAMPSRAIENKVYLAVANRTGTENQGGEELYFNGQSGIWDYYGSLLTNAGKDDETVLIAEIEPENVRNKSFNDYNDIFEDRRPEMYIY